MHGPCSIHVGAIFAVNFPLFSYQDASEYSQSIIDDFSASCGYKLLFEFMLKLDSTGEQEARDAQRHVILLTSDLVSCGFDKLAVTTNDPGPFNPRFKIPKPLDGGKHLNLPAI